MPNQALMTELDNCDKPYHHGDLRQVLIQAACCHIAAEGTEKLSLRALAREAGVSPTAPYRHFPTKNCLLAAIATEGFRELGEAFHAHIDGLPAQEHLLKLKECGKTYVQYALSNPVKFHLMFGDVLADFSSHDFLQVQADATFALFMAVAREAQTAGAIENACFEEVAAYLWCAIHGAASLILKKMHRFEGDNIPASFAVVRYVNDNLDVMLDRILKGLLTQPANQLAALS